MTTRARLIEAVKQWKGFDAVCPSDVIAECYIDVYYMGETTIKEHIAKTLTDASEKYGINLVSGSGINELEQNHKNHDFEELLCEQKTHLFKKPNESIAFSQGFLMGLFTDKPQKAPE